MLFAAVPYARAFVNNLDGDVRHFGFVLDFCLFLALAITVLSEHTPSQNGDAQA